MAWTVESNEAEQVGTLGLCRAKVAVQGGLEGRGNRRLTSIEVTAEAKGFGATRSYRPKTTEQWGPQGTWGRPTPVEKLGLYMKVNKKWGSRAPWGRPKPKIAVQLG